MRSVADVAACPVELSSVNIRTVHQVGRALSS